MWQKSARMPLFLLNRIGTSTGRARTRHEFLSLIAVRTAPRLIQTLSDVPVFTYLHNDLFERTSRVFLLSAVFVITYRKL